MPSEKQAVEALSSALASSLARSLSIRLMRHFLPRVGLTNGSRSPDPLGPQSFRQIFQRQQQVEQASVDGAVIVGLQCLGLDPDVAERRWMHPLDAMDDGVEPANRGGGSVFAAEVHKQG